MDGLLESGVQGIRLAGVLQDYAEATVTKARARLDEDSGSHACASVCGENERSAFPFDNEWLAGLSRKASETRRE